MYEINDRESRTILYLKAVFIILVLYIHTWAYTNKGYVNFGDGNLELNTPMWLWNFEYTVSVIIARCATPGFFLLSSILLFRKDFKFKENIKKRIRTICIPWFLVTTFWILVFAVAQRFPAIAPFFSNEKTIIANWNIFNFIDAYLGLTGDPLVYPLWFLQNLLFLNIIAKGLKFIIDRAPIVSLVLLIALYLSPFEKLIFCLQTPALFWFCMGYYMVKYDIKIRDIEKIKPIVLTVIYVVLIIASLLLKETYIYRFLDKAAIVIGILWFTRMIYSVEENKMLAFLANYSFFLYITHELTTRMAIKAYTKIFGSSLIAQIMEYIAVPLLVMVLCIGFGVFLSKKAPKLYGLCNGNRVARA